MQNNTKVIKESIYSNPEFKPKKKRVPLSIAKGRVTVRVKGWKVDTTKYNILPRVPHFTAVIRRIPSDSPNLKAMSYNQLISLFNRNVISPFLPIVDFQQMHFFKDGRLWFKKIAKRDNIG